MIFIHWLDDIVNIILEYESHIISHVLILIFTIFSLIIYFCGCLWLRLLLSIIFLFHLEVVVWRKFRQQRLCLWSWQFTGHRFKAWQFRIFGPIFLELSTKNDSLIFIDPAFILYFTFYDGGRNLFDMCTNTSHIKVKHGTTNNIIWVLINTHLFWLLLNPWQWRTAIFMLLFDAICCSSDVTSRMSPYFKNIFSSLSVSPRWSFVFSNLQLYLRG